MSLTAPLTAAAEIAVNKRNLTQLAEAEIIFASSGTRMIIVLLGAAGGEWAQGRILERPRE
jgi:hypothetical protein